MTASWPVVRRPAACLYRAAPLIRRRHSLSGLMSIGRRSARQTVGLTVHHCGRRHEEVDARGPGPESDERDAVGVAAELADVLLHPVERCALKRCSDYSHTQFQRGIKLTGHLVHEAEVGQSRLSLGPASNVEKSLRSRARSMSIKRCAQHKNRKGQYREREREGERVWRRWIDSEPDKSRCDCFR